MRTGLPSRAFLGWRLGAPRISPEPEQTWNSADIKAPRFEKCSILELLELAGMNAQSRKPLNLSRHEHLGHKPARTLG